MIRNPEMRRILELPDSPNDPKNWTEFAARWTERLRRPTATAGLRDVQGACLEEVHRNLEAYLAGDRPLDEDGEPLGPRGLLAPVGVGHGKTGVGFLLAEVVRRQIGAVKALLIVPPELVQKTQTDYAWWARRFRFPRPTILSMGKLSHPSATRIFEEIKPNLVIIDEAHAFARFESARTKRLIRWVVANRETICVFMSGTLTQKSIKDYRHLADLALRDCVPIPVDNTDLELWQSMLDVGGQPDYNAKKALLPLVNWHLGRLGKPPIAAGRVTKALVRDAYSDRLRACPGVVATSDSSSDAGLVIRKWRVEAPVAWEAACDDFTDEGMWELPDGTEIVDAFGAGRARVQLSSGYYTRWVWPMRCSDCSAVWPLGTVSNSSVCDCSAELTNAPDEEWLEKRRYWSAIERAVLSNLEAKSGEDSPALVRRLAEQGKLGPSKKRALADWMGVRDRYYTPGLGYQPPVEYVDLDPGPEWLAERATEWAKANGRGIIWYSTPHVGEALRAAGFEVFGAGTQLDTSRGLRVDNPCAKIDVQGTGKNLQMTQVTGRGGTKGWHRNLLLEFGGNARTWEQMLGRTHRPGQLADNVWVDVLMAGGYRVESYHAARVGAEYIERTLSMRQKLRIATFGDDLKSPLKKARKI